MESSSFDTIHDYTDQINFRAQQYSRLTANIIATFDGIANYTDLVNFNSMQDVVFSTDITVPIILENNVTESKNLEDAVILLNSRLVSYFESPNSTATIMLVFNNYFNSIYPAFLAYPTALPDNSRLSFIFAGAALGITCLMMTYWIFISLKIDKKRYDIMIWFLDIPIPYVSHLGSHCDLYLKQFVTVKELTQKGIPLDEEEDDFD
jgi:hypothetical protein